VSQSDFSSPIGTELAGKYEIRSLIGEGGMSMIYLGYHKLMQREVAIKFLQESYLKHEPSRRRFQQEAQAASRLDHPNLITVYDFGITDDDRPYLVMNLIEGESLGELLDSKLFLPAERAVRIFIQVCEGLAHAHEQGIIHRDLKPENIMLLPGKDGSDIARVVDFGVAKMLPRSGMPVDRLTRSGELFGTILYLSPEQCLMKDIDARSDIYALGCVMYETITGLPPFSGENATETMNKHIDEAPQAPDTLSEELTVPADLSDVIMKTLAKDPDTRFQTMTELKDALQKTLSEHQPVAEPNPAPQAQLPLPSSNNRTIIVIAVACTLLGLVLAFCLQHIK